MKSPIIYRIKRKDIKKIKSQIDFYKDLGVNAISVSLFDNINEDIIDEVLKLNKYLDHRNIRLIIRFDLIELGNRLLDQKIKITDRSNPQIRNASFQFINYLIKHGIRGFDFSDISNLTTKNDDYKKLFVYIRELSKNTFNKNYDILTIADINSSNTDILVALSSKKYNTFSAIINNYTNIGNNFYEDKLILSTMIIKLEKERASLGLILDKNLVKYLNYKNYPYYSKTILIMSSLFLRGIPVINEDDINSYNDDLFSYYKNIIEIIKKYKSINRGSFLDILRKDKDVFAYIREYKNEKVLCLYNFSEKEILINLSYYYIEDFYDYKYLIGNYGMRKIVKNICLRAYEGVSFIKI